MMSLMPWQSATAKMMAKVVRWVVVAWGRAVVVTIESPAVSYSWLRRLPRPPKARIVHFCSH
jgi:hypothetical protein